MINNKPEFDKDKKSCKCPYCDSELKEENINYCFYCKIDIVYCTKCGSPVSSNIEYCPNCGAKL